MTVSAEVEIKFDIRQTEDAFGTDDSVNDTDYIMRYSFADGTSADQFDELFVGKVDMSASSNQDDELPAAGPGSGLNSVYGVNLTGAEVVGVFVVNEDPAMTNSTITVGAHPTRAWITWGGGPDTAVTNIGPNGFFMMFNPGAAGLGAISAGTTDMLRIACGSGAGAEVRRIYMMRSA